MGFITSLLTSNLSSQQKREFEDALSGNSLYMDSKRSAFEKLSNDELVRKYRSDYVNRTEKAILKEIIEERKENGEF